MPKRVSALESSSASILPSLCSAAAARHSACELQEKGRRRRWARRRATCGRGRRGGRVTGVQIGWQGVSWSS
eukprot:scaffold191444_cov41-Tisochrysis_lutea.AAC.3